jgi:hypothetical protein
LLANSANADELALAHDRRIYPIQMENPNFPYPRWDGHPAQCLLKIDVDSGKHKRYKPELLRMTRKEYKLFPLEVFRKHIHQVERSRLKN